MSFAVRQVAAARVIPIESRTAGLTGDSDSAKVPGFPLHGSADLDSERLGIRFVANVVVGFHKKLIQTEG